ncbi:response regulator transcription factor [Pelovirga terrestris]|uniref:Response regulator n=1 Tax=Pelovirga terrestris TaxID=2771352 RepID=A0A8J6UHS3_9BACT|nr:response regulator [Pelovirga terrestris]MBD1401878.1 response regulator [Pelovirga terrestris]
MAKILFAEDSDTDYAYLADILKNAAHQYVGVRNGEDAEAHAQREKFDLFILDVIMPGKNGFQICRSLKRNPQTAGTPVIITTSKDSDSDKFWGEKQGADVYITKPFTPNQLLAEINKVLN